MLYEVITGATLGQPHDVAQQRRVLEATLALLAQGAVFHLYTIGLMYQSTHQQGVVGGMRPVCRSILWEASPYRPQTSPQAACCCAGHLA